MSSVRKNEREPHRFNVMDTALDLHDYTTNLIANDKVFKRTYQSLINRIEYESSMIYHCCRSANEDLDTRKKDEAEMRIQLEEEAISHCKWLKTEIRIAQKKFHLRTKQIIYWTKLVNRTMDLIKGWEASEKRSLKENHGL